MTPNAKLSKRSVSKSWGCDPCPGSAVHYTIIHPGRPPRHRTPSCTVVHDPVPETIVNVSQPQPGVWFLHRVRRRLAGLVNPPIKDKFFIFVYYPVVAYVMFLFFAYRYQLTNFFVTHIFNKHKKHFGYTGILHSSVWIP